MAKQPAADKWVTEDTHQWQVTTDTAGVRLDIFVMKALSAPQLSRQMVKSCIRRGAITVNARPQKPSYLTKNRDLVLYGKTSTPPAQRCDALERAALVYDDDTMFAINKPNHMVVYPSPHHPRGTLIDCLPAVIGLPNSDVTRAGLVHRLDKDTTGLILFAKTNQAQAKLQTQFRHQTVDKTYVAIVHGTIHPATGTIRAAIGRSLRHRPPMSIDLVSGRPGLTHFSVLSRGRHYTLVSCRIVSGRTHQVRLHFAHIGHPIVGDHDYGLTTDRKLCFGQYLHAWKLAFSHPQTNQRVHLVAPPPSAFKKMLKKLKLCSGLVFDE